MTPEHKTLVKNSWQKLAPLADKAASLFYDRLFELDATMRALFKTTNLTEQRRKLIQPWHWLSMDSIIWMRLFRPSQT